MKKFTVPGDTTVSETIWNTPKVLTKALKKQTTNESSCKIWVRDTVTNRNTDGEHSQETYAEPSTTPRMGPSQEPPG